MDEEKSFITEEKAIMDEMKDVRYDEDSGMRFRDDKGSSI